MCIEGKYIYAYYVILHYIRCICVHVCVWLYANQIKESIVTSNVNSLLVQTWPFLIFVLIPHDKQTAAPFYRLHDWSKTWRHRTQRVPDGWRMKVKESEQMSPVTVTSDCHQSLHHLMAWVRLNLHLLRRILNIRGLQYMQYITIPGMRLRAKQSF